MGKTKNNVVFILFTILCFFIFPSSSFSAQGVFSYSKSVMITINMSSFNGFGNDDIESNLLDSDYIISNINKSEIIIFNE